VQIALKLLRAFFTAKQGKYKLPRPATCESLELVKKHNIFVKYTQKPSRNFYTENKKYFLRSPPVSKHIAANSEKSDLGIANYLYFTNKHIFYIHPFLSFAAIKKQKRRGDIFAIRRASPQAVSNIYLVASRSRST
jgi:hypothetical protein